MNALAEICGSQPTLAANAVGAGLKPAHFAEILAARPEIGFFEIHAENYMNAGGPNLRWLAAIGKFYPLSVHGVGLSLGSTEKLDRDHLARLKQVVERTAPALVSEHLAWCDFSGRAFPDLLPLPYDEAALARIADRIDAVQQALGRQILIENPATYLRFQGDALGEPQFLSELSVVTGCGLLLDVNNVYVSAINHGFDAEDYLDAFPLERVGEIHLAGHAEARDANGSFLIDNHGGPVADEVWALYRHVVWRGGPRPTLIEWDNDVPDWNVLLGETQKARTALAACPTHAPFAPPPVLAPEMRKTPEAPALEQSWQTAFAKALRNPEAPVPPLFARCDADSRFSVYRNNSAVALTGALKEQFPTVLQLVGEEAFGGLARAFARDNPPLSPVLGDYGAGFADFLASFLAQIAANETPFLPDVARLDWACLQAARAEDAEPCGLAHLAALTPDAVGAVRAKTHPSLTLIASDWPLLALRDPKMREISDWRGETILILRPHAETRLIAVSSGGAAFLRACEQGAALAQAAQDGEKAEPGFDFGQTLVGFVQVGAFVEFIADNKM